MMKYSRLVLVRKGSSWQLHSITVAYTPRVLVPEKIIFKYCRDQSLKRGFHMVVKAVIQHFRTENTRSDYN
jgi:hypothetical protein